MTKTKSRTVKSQIKPVANEIARNKHFKLLEKEYPSIAKDLARNIAAFSPTDREINFAVWGAVIGVLDANDTMAAKVDKILNEKQS
jgi:hypothetical protein